jgi:hypothetical protein
MSNLCVYSFSISIDGYGAGPRQSHDNPLGVGGMALHQWAFATRTFCETHGREGGTSGIDDDFAPHHRNGITDLESLQQTSATKSANCGQGRAAANT